MSTIVAFDTASAPGSLALCVDGEIVAEECMDAPDGFAHVLFAAIANLLAQTARRLIDIDCFAVTSGPGSFTGLRVGLAAAKGLAEALGKACAPMSNLRVIASTVSGGAAGARRAVILDARRGQVFAAVYDGSLRLVCAEVVTDLRAWLPTAHEAASFVAPPEFHPVIREIHPDAAILQPPAGLAAPLARLAELDGPGAWTDPVMVDANYVRRSDAELFQS